MGSGWFGGVYLGQYSWVPSTPASGYAFHGDLTTVFVQYVEALHDAALVASDSNTLISEDEDNMIAGTGDRRDLNTRYNEYLH